MRTATVLVLVVLMAVGMDMARGLQKPGTCPEVPPDTSGTCDEQCSDDGSCPKDMKCCSNGCGHICMSPVFPKAGPGSRGEEGMDVYNQD